MNQIDIEFITHIKNIERRLIDGKRTDSIDPHDEQRIRNQLSDFSGRVRKGIRRFLHHHPRAENWRGG